MRIASRVSTSPKLMQITLHLPPEAQQQLIAVARTTIGSPTPTQQQLDNVLGALAHFALKRAYEQVSVPALVAGPLPADLAKTLARALGPVAPDVRRGIPPSTTNP
jgi:hypothetical protein